jgi:hypothetical protein
MLIETVDRLKYSASSSYSNWPNVVNVFQVELHWLGALMRVSGDNNTKDETGHGWRS